MKDRDGCSTSLDTKSDFLGATAGLSSSAAHHRGNPLLDKPAVAPEESRGCEPRGHVQRCSSLLVPFIFSVSVLACGAIPAAAQEQQPQIDSLRAGFDGHFKVGYWTPFEVVVESGGQEITGRVELTVLDGDAVPSRVRSKQIVRLRPGEKTAIRLVAKIGQFKGDVTVGFRSEDRLVASRTFAAGADGPLGGIMRPDERLIVTLGSPLSPSDQAHFDERRTRIAQLTDASQLPTEWYALEGVDAVIIATADEAVAAQLATASPQLAALDLWVRMGGMLVASVGENAQQVLASTSPLAAMAPGTLGAMVPLDPSAVLETYSETAEPLESRGGRLTVQVPKLDSVRGKIEAFAGRSPRDLPLVVRSARGFGEVVFFAFDLNRPPLADWQARGQLLDKLLRPTNGKSSQSESGTLGEVTTLGFVDLAGQLRGALDQFADVPMVPFWLVAALVVAYIACTGPLDYYLVQRVLRRPEATWITFAVTLAVFSGGAYALAYRLKGREVRLNQVDLVDFDAQTKLVRGTTWANLFSPATETYDLALRPATGFDSSAPAQTILSWLGMTGTGFGSMNPQAASLGLFTEPYDFSSHLDRLERVPLAVWSSKAFVGRWWTESAPPIDAHLVDTGTLTGKLMSHLDIPLTDGVLLYDRWAYRLQQVRPGHQIDIERIDPQTIETFLHRVTLQGDRSVAPAYDRASFDVPRIVEIMSLHELAGGEKYSQLNNEHQGFVDLSRLEACGQAILIARSADSAATLVRDGQPIEPEIAGHWTFYRFVFPVKQQGVK